MVNEARLKGGIGMNLESCKLVFVVSPSDDSEQEKTVKEIIADEYGNQWTMLINGTLVCVWELQTVRMSKEFNEIDD